MTEHPSLSSDTALSSARRTLQIESQALQDLSARLDDSFAQVVALLLACRGRVVVSGIGKTGHVARKIAATLASTGTPAFFVHAAEAVHGDLGMITRDDVLIAISYSGSGQELLTILPVARRMGAKLVAITGNPQSSWPRWPTCTWTPASRRSLPAEPGAHSQHHRRAGPGRCAGRRLPGGARLRPAGLRPLASRRRAGSPPADACARRDAPGRRPAHRSHWHAGPAGAQDHVRQGHGHDRGGRRRRPPAGIFTDGDLRRLIASQGDIRGLAVDDGMTRSPRSIGPTRWPWKRRSRWTNFDSITCWCSTAMAPARRAAHA